MPCIQPSRCGRVRTGGPSCWSALWLNGALLHPAAAAVALAFIWGFLAILHLARGRHSSFLGGLVLGRGFGSHFWKLRLESVFSDFAFFLASHFIAYHKNACVT